VLRRTLDVADQEAGVMERTLGYDSHILEPFISRAGPAAFTERTLQRPKPEVNLGHRDKMWRIAEFGEVAPAVRTESTRILQGGTAADDHMTADNPRPQSFISGSSSAHDGGPGIRRAADAPQNPDASCYGGPGIRTPMRLPAAVFKTAALPIRTSPPTWRKVMQCWLLLNGGRVSTDAP
jgi:hypothetical protein